MKRFQLCLLVVFMLLVSNFVTESAMVTNEIHSHFGRPQSAIINERKKTAHNEAIQRRAQGSRSTITGSEQENASQNTPTPVEQSQKAPKPATNETTKGANSADTKTTIGSIQGGSSDANTSQRNGAPASTPGSNENNSAEKESTPGSTVGERGSSATGTDPDPNSQEPLAADAPAMESTTTGPAAEGDCTEGSSGSTSTSIHSPTEIVKGADSQALVKAGVVSFVLSVGIVLTLFM